MGGTRQAPFMPDSSDGDESILPQWELLPEDSDAARVELGPEAGEDKVREAAMEKAHERWAARQGEVFQVDVQKDLEAADEAASQTAERKVEEGLDKDLDEDTDKDADDDAQLSPEEQAALDEAKELANKAAEGGAIAGAFAWISENVTKVFAWIKEKLGGIFGKLGFKKDKKDKEKEEGQRVERTSRRVSGEDIAALAVDIANDDAPSVELPAGNQNCWGWVQAVYGEVGYDLGSTPRLYRDLTGEGSKFSDFDALKPGDHLIYHNKNSDDENGNHSGIFVRWLGKDARRAEVVNYSGGSNGRVEIDEVAFDQEEIRGVRQPEDEEQEKFQDFEMLDPEAPVFTFPGDVGTRFSSNYGWRIHPIHGDWRFHEGIDFGAPEGTPVICTQDGAEVISSGSYGGAGNMVQLRVPGVGEPKFMHFMKLGAPVGAVLNKGDVIGYVGNTGVSTSAHLHFEIEKDGQTVDPNPYVSEAVRAEELLLREQRQAEYDSSPMM